MKNNVENKSINREDPFLTKNVWLKRLGLFILIIGLYPTILSPNEINIIFKILIGFAITAYVIKHIIGFIKSFNY